MSDTKIRELERRWKETGSPDDEATYLRERVRSGELTLEKLEIAAFCAHRAAELALGKKLPTRPTDPAEWVWSLGPTRSSDALDGGPTDWRACGGQAALVAASAAIQTTLAMTQMSADISLPARECLESVSAWLAFPSTSVLEKIGRTAMQVPLPFSGDKGTPERIEWAIRCLGEAALTPDQTRDTVERMSTAVHLCLQALVGEGTPAAPLKLTESMRKAVTRWSLG